MRVALVTKSKFTPALKGRHMYFGLSGLCLALVYVSRGTALRACPWLSYFAPLALSLEGLQQSNGDCHYYRPEHDA
jgi:hypothetical protein